MSAFVYLLECSDGSLYTGWCRSLEKRLAEHQAGRGARYTRSRRPVRLAYVEEVGEDAVARRREYRLRHLPRAAKLALVATFVQPGGGEPRVDG